VPRRRAARGHEGAAGLTPRAALLRDGAIVAVIAAASIAALKQEQFDYLFKVPWEGFVEVLPTTAWAALKVWSFWLVAAAVIGGLLLRAEPALGVLDAAIAGMGGVQIVAFIAGNTLGPIGLYRGWTIWALLLAGAVALWRRPPRIARPSLSPGQRIALLAFALIAPGTLLLQLGSPVPPYMDVLATPAAAQRIITFGVYLPFDSDPYGYWDASSQLPGLELFYAFLGLGSGTSLALLADTAAIVPMAAFLVLTTYRLGRTIAGDLAGGMASLLLLATMCLRVLTNMHGRSVAFVLVAMGLAFLFDQERNRVRVTIGALALATAVATHAIMGALGMMVASATVLVWLLSGELVAFLAGVGVLAGATLVALPAVAVGLRFELPYPVLPLVQLAGVAIVWLAAGGLHARTVKDRTGVLRWALAAFAVVVLVWRPYDLMPNNHWMRFPVVVFGGAGGLALMLCDDLRRRRADGGAGAAPALVSTITLALLIGVGIEYVSYHYWMRFRDPAVQTAMHDWFYKVDYWHPFVLVFPAGYFAARLSQVLPRRALLLVLLAILFVPWRDHLDPYYDATNFSNPDYTQHSIAEAWSYQLATAKHGYWGNTFDHRWAQGPAELELIAVLRAEIAAGRITTATHIVELSPRVYLYGDNLLYSVYTGINGDPYLADHPFDASIAGSRLRPAAEAPQRLAQRPPYVVIHNDAIPLPPEALQGYTEVFNRDEIRLLREDSVLTENDAGGGE
jgi:hypothetical protein